MKSKPNAEAAEVHIPRQSALLPLGFIEMGCGLIQIAAGLPHLNEVSFLGILASAAGYIAISASRPNPDLDKKTSYRLLLWFNVVIMLGFMAYVSGLTVSLVLFGLMSQEDLLEIAEKVQISGQSYRTAPVTPIIWATAMLRLIVSVVLIAVCGFLLRVSYRKLYGKRNKMMPIH